MKNLLWIGCLIFLSAYTVAQSIPNSNFELWDDEALFPTPESWNTPNNYTLLADVYAVNKSTDAYSGSYAISLETILIDVLGTQILVPGAITYADFIVDVMAQTFSYQGGFFLQENVRQLTGMYKYQNAGNDSAVILMYNFRHREGEAYDTIGYGYTYLHDADEWTPFEVTMRYINSHVPDTFNVLIMSTTDEGLMNPAHQGSLLLIDSLSIHTNTGIIDFFNKKVPLHVFPNPASELISFEAESSVKGRVITINDATGNMLLTKEFNNKRITLPLDGFPPGLYNYRVTEGQRITNSGSFIRK